jgi:DNA-binding transcriptional regulator LsrR (DeoR family)
MGLTQQKIAERLNISRMHVQRGITKSKKLGIVKIEINDPLTNCFELENILKDRFFLKEAFVAPKPKGKTDIKQVIGKTAATYFQNSVQDNQIIGIGWGSTLREMTRSIKGRPLSNTQLVLLHGHFPQKMDESPYEVIGKLADAFDAPGYYISAPAVVDTPESREIIISEKSIKCSLEMAKNADLAIIGIGNAGENFSLVKAGFLSGDEVKRLRDLGTIGEVCGFFFDKNGKPIETGYENRIIGVDLDDLKRIDLVIGVAGGDHKKEAILGAMRGGYLDALVTDEATANHIIQHA